MNSLPMNSLLLLFAIRRKQDLDDWRVLVRDFKMSPLEFYALLEAAVRQRQTPDTEIRQKDFKEGNLLSDRRVYLRLTRDRLLFDCCAVPFGTSYLFSYWLWFMPRPFTLFHLLGLVTTCGILPALSIQVFGMGRGLPVLGILLLALFFVVKSGVFRTRRKLEEYLHGLTIIGVIFELLFRMPTYFEKDTAAAFHTTIYECYIEVLDGLTQTHGLRALTEDERCKPEMRDFYKK